MAFGGSRYLEVGLNLLVTPAKSISKIIPVLRSFPSAAAPACDHTFIHGMSSAARGDESRPGHHSTKDVNVRGLPYRTSAKFLDFLTPLSPLPEFYTLIVNKFGSFFEPLPPSVRTSYMEAPLT